MDYADVPDMSVEEAWDALKTVHDDDNGTRDDFIEVRRFSERLRPLLMSCQKIKILCKADRNLTWVDVEKQLRGHKLNKYFLIAYVSGLPTHRDCRKH